MNALDWTLYLLWYASGIWAVRAFYRIVRDELRRPEPRDGARW